ncbi:MAG: cytochrome c oxidase assembly protein subunit 15 [Psychrosphaera sp.]|jgi:cytochrome c oxidase assembly protein subunit 15|uniref:COX15/CtaA family protein n=1 Tax=Psychrosphaera aquimarina TaxID=2044854 RepID=A0ABU3QYN9_9GAMM|nr:COX15/CtaA family protein [Psychrosphaera aquimarina]MDU0112163.1 COX15/CtaA family protein [Psychrosphaera aquimarina]
MVRTLYKLNLIAILVAAVVVILGAYTRLTDAGLGCPDWPGCYGFLSVPTHAADIAHAEGAFPDRPVEHAKAWNEMIHRYFAGSLGFLILIMFLLSLKTKQRMALPTILLLTVCFQALLGMWTVTMNLMPLVVMGHLLGGFTTFCLLVISALTLSRQINAGHIASSPSSLCHRLYRLSQLAFICLVIQIALGGWTASNYAAVACTELPICEGNWTEKFDIKEALTIPTGHDDYEYGVMHYEARMSIHVLHRFGAILVLFVFIALAFNLMKSKSTELKRFGMILTLLVSTQFLLGVSNVVFQLPLFIAVSHNFVALCLLASLITLMFNLSSQGRQQASFNTWIKG